jgi:hypothetical protein
MIRLLLLLFVLIPIAEIRAQLTIVPGGNLSICSNKYRIVDTTQLDPIVTGNIGNYHCKWNFIYNYGLSVYTFGSMIMDDTLACSPKIIGCDALPSDIWMPLYVTVTDSIGDMARDSIYIRFSWFGYLPMNTTATIVVGDSLTIHALSGGAIPPLHYLWSPNYKISDSSIASPLVKPNISTIYTCIVTDSIGCVSDWGDIWYINVDSDASGLHEINSSMLKAYPNPTINEELFQLKIPNDLQDAYLIIVDMMGRVIIREVLNRDKSLAEINTETWATGLYYYSLNNGNQSLGSGIFQVVK